ncbi:MAG TPA: hypothetical protein VGK40_00190, partial [Verrucomicrobiae bacterium]
GYIDEESEEHVRTFRIGQGWAAALAAWIGINGLIGDHQLWARSLLAEGDKAVLVAPDVCFRQEILRLKVASARFAPNPATNGFKLQAAESEFADLRSALSKARLPRAAREEILQRYAAERRKIQQFTDAREAMRGDRWGLRQKESGPPPQLQLALPIDGLPAEFEDYLRGANAWHQGQREEACTAWEALLALPKSQRQFKSTWAAFMLGKARMQEEPDKAVEYFQQVRELAGAGLADSSGLAGSSLGWEAKVHLEHKRFLKAIELYLEQADDDDLHAILSLRWTAAEAMRAGPETLRELAENPQARLVMTACAISANSQSSDPASLPPSGAAAAWLEAVEAAGVSDAESAEQLALAAYQIGQMDTAQRWIKRARHSPVAQWLQAKLLVREGKLDQGLSLLAKVAPLFPLVPPDTNEVFHPKFQDNLLLPRNGSPDNSAARRVRGELGVLRLALGDYIKALDAFLASGHWIDAAYVGERVLTVDELKAYVDRHWPEDVARLSPPQQAEQALRQMRESSPGTTREQIRHLLARRLTRLLRGDEARAYYPAEVRPQFDQLVAALLQGEDESLSAEQRAAGFWGAARLVREHGSNLLATEVEPDWRACNYESGVTVTTRATNEIAKLTQASADEIRRARAHRADPEARYHYLYQAAFLGLDAAKLLPNQTRQKAIVLCAAGSWIKYEHPVTADVFYKYLVRSCRRTPLGVAADRRRWFPKMDDDGNILKPLPRQEPKLVESPPESAPGPSVAIPSSPGVRISD